MINFTAQVIIMLQKSAQTHATLPCRPKNSTGSCLQLLLLVAIRRWKEAKSRSLEPKYVFLGVSNIIHPEITILRPNGFPLGLVTVAVACDRSASIWWIICLDDPCVAWGPSASLWLLLVIIVGECIL